MDGIMTLHGIIRESVGEYLGDSDQGWVAEDYILGAIEEAGYFDHFYQTRLQHVGLRNSVDDVELIDPPERFTKAVWDGFDGSAWLHPSVVVGAEARFNVARALYSILLDGAYIKPDAKAEFAAEHER